MALSVLLLAQSAAALQGVSEAGGVMYDENFYSEVTVDSCRFERNVGGYGGAMSLYDSSVVVTNCTFDSNEVGHRNGSSRRVNSGLGHCLVRAWGWEEVTHGE